MEVKNIQWLSQGTAEAEVEISDQNFSCVAFCWPCEVQIGDTLNAPLHVFDVKNAMLSDRSEPGIWKLSKTGLSQKVVAKLIDSSKQILAVGGITLVVDEFLPGGIENGNFVEFECARIDLW